MLVILAILFSFPACAQSGSVKTKAQLTTEISTNLPDTAAGTITPFTVRQTLLDILVSAGATQKTSLTSEIAANLPDNTTGNIAASALRQTLQDLLTNLALLATQSQSALSAEINTNISPTVTPAAFRRTLSDLVNGMQLVSTEPCDLIISCGEAWSVTRGMISSYNGPLFQLYNGTTTLDIGMNASRTVDMTTWSAFCSGVATNCHITKIYAQIQGTHNNLVAMDFDSAAFYGCSAGSPCRAEFRIEAATGLPRIEAGCDPGGGNGTADGCNTSPTPGPGKYLVDVGASDTALIGVNSGTNPVTVLYNGQFITQPIVSCCGNFGIAHQFQAAQTDGTDFMISARYGTCTNYGAPSGFYCFDIDGENINTFPDQANTLSSATAINYVVLIDHSGGPSPPSNSTIWYNGHTIWSQNAMPLPSSSVGAYVYNIVGPYMRLGGGGDLSQRSPILWREGLIANSILSSGEKAAILSNNQAFYPTLLFP